MRQILLFALTCLLVNISSAQLMKSAGPRTNATMQPVDSVVVDITLMFDQFEASIEKEFEKLKKQAKSEITLLNDKIRQLDQQIQHLQDQANILQQGINQLDILIAGAGSGSSTDGLKKSKAAKQKQLTDINLKIQQAINDRNAAKQQILELEKQIAQLDKDKLAQLDALKKQEQKVLDQALKQKEQEPSKYTTFLNTVQHQHQIILQDSIRGMNQRVRFR